MVADSLVVPWVFLVWAYLTQSFIDVKIFMLLKCFILRCKQLGYQFRCIFVVSTRRAPVLSPLDDVPDLWWLVNCWASCISSLKLSCEVKKKCWNRILHMVTALSALQKNIIMCLSLLHLSWLWEFFPEKIDSFPLS